MVGTISSAPCRATPIATVANRHGERVAWARLPVALLASQANDMRIGGGSTVTDTSKGSRMQGEGDYRAARRHRRKLQQFIATSDTQELAREAAPRSGAEQQEMLEAERQGRAKAKGRKSGIRHTDEE